MIERCARAALAQTYTSWDRIGPQVRRCYIDDASAVIAEFLSACRKPETVARVQRRLIDADEPQTARTIIGILGAIEAELASLKEQTHGRSKSLCD